MSWPFTPLVSFLAGLTPKVTAAFLNSVQSAINAVARPSYLEQTRCKYLCPDAATAQVVVSATMIKDAATSEIVFCEYASATLTPAHLTPTPAMTWPTSRWLYAYLVCTNGVASFEVSETAPYSTIARTPLWKTADETRRYLVSFYSDGSGNLYRGGSIFGRYTYGDRVPVVSVSAGSTTLVTESLATAVPPHALHVEIQGYGDSTYTSSNVVYVTPDGVGSISTFPILFVWTAYSGSGDRPWATGSLTLPLLNLDSIQWRTTSTGVSSLVINVMGWEE